MALFDKLFSRRPRLPPPIYDPFGGDAALRRVMEGLEKGDWRAADDLLTSTKNGDDRAARAGQIIGAGQGWRPWIDAWHAAKSDQSEAWLIRGACRIGAAWEVRGSDRAQEVEDEVWPVFHGMLGEAEADLREAIQRAEGDATPWAYLLLTGSALGAEPAELLSRLDEARRRDPEGWLAPWQALNALSEKWSGSHDAMFGVAREASKGAPAGSQLHSLIAAAHLHRWEYFAMEDPPDSKGQGRYFDQDDVQKDLGRAWERGPGSPHFQHGRFTNGQLALFALGFSLGEDMDLARAAFEKLNNHLTMTPWSHFGDPAEAFVRFRDAALR